jgi:hypothetical protein
LATLALGLEFYETWALVAPIAPRGLATLSGVFGYIRGQARQCRRTPGARLPKAGGVNLTFGTLATPVQIRGNADLFMVPSVAFAPLGWLSYCPMPRCLAHIEQPEIADHLKAGPAILRQIADRRDGVIVECADVGTPGSRRCATPKPRSSGTCRTISAFSAVVAATG